MVLQFLLPHTDITISARVYPFAVPFNFLYPILTSPTKHESQTSVFGFTVAADAFWGAGVEWVVLRSGLIVGLLVYAMGFKPCTVNRTSD